MDGLGFPVLHGQVEGYLSKFKRRPIRRGKCEVPTRLRFYSTENIGRPAALAFVVPSGFPARCSRRGGSNIGMQRYRLLIQAHHWFNSTHWSTRLMAEESGLSQNAIVRIWRAFRFAAAQ